MNAHPRFINFIEDTVALLELPKPKVEKNGYMFKVEDRWIEAKYDPVADRLAFVSLVHVSPPGQPLRADLLGKFNAKNLFDGGCALVAMDNAFVYLCQSNQLKQIKPAEMRGRLAAFLARASLAALWFLENESEDQADVDAPTQAKMDDHQGLRA